MQSIENRDPNVASFRRRSALIRGLGLCIPELCQRTMAIQKIILDVEAAMIEL